MAGLVRAAGFKMRLRDLRKARYIALETFYADGKGVITPVWQAFEDDKVYVWTDASSWKVKRVRQVSRVRLCRSNPRGTPRSDWVEGQARILDDEASLEAQIKRLAGKYRLLFWPFWLAGKLRGAEYVVIEISEAESVEKDQGITKRAYGKLVVSVVVGVVALVLIWRLLSQLRQAAPKQQNE